MRSKLFITTMGTLLLSANVLADSSLARDKIKSGILPSGDLYSIFEIQCPDASKTHIAMMDRRTRWCMIEGAGLKCVREADLAADQACAASQLQIAGGDETLGTDS